MPRDSADPALFSTGYTISNLRLFRVIPRELPLTNSPNAMLRFSGDLEPSYCPVALDPWDSNSFTQPAVRSR